MIEVDRIMMEDFSIPVELMMEHAAINLAKLVVKNISSQNIDGPILIVAGSGNNGAGGITAARKLLGWGYHVKLFLPKGQEKLRETAKEQLHRLEKIRKIDIITDFDQLNTLRSLSELSVIIDAYIGYGFKGKPDLLSQNVFHLMQSHQNVISLDTPSGLDTTTGSNVGNVLPTATLTLAFPKIGMIQERYVHNKHHLGELYLADIGVPKKVFESMLGIDWSAQYINQEMLNQVYEKFATKSLIPIDIHQEVSSCGWMSKT